MASRSDMTAVALAAATAVDTPDVPASARRRFVRRLATLSSRAAGIVTVVPFVPVNARVAAGAITGVATAVDVALRPRKDRPTAPAYAAPDGKRVTADPVLFATDTAAVLATTAIAASRSVASGTRRVATRRTAAVIGVAIATVAGAFVVYRFVVRPIMRRRAVSDWAATEEAWTPAATEAATVTEGAAVPSAESGAETPAADAAAGAATDAEAATDAAGAVDAAAEAESLVTEPDVVPEVTPAKRRRLRRG